MGKKTYLFHNTEAALLPESYKNYMSCSVSSIVEKLYRYKPNSNRNTGTCLMTDTLQKIIKADKLIPRNYEFSEHVDTVITNILHRIGMNIKVDIDYWKKIMRFCDRVIPMTLGFAFDRENFYELDCSLKYLLKMMAERVELAVRTEYDAYCLERNGIKNVQVLGCPSLFYHMDRNFKIDDKSRHVSRVNFNFTTDFGNLGISQKEAVDVHWPLLLYFIRLHSANKFKIDLTLQKPPFAEISDIHAILLSYYEVHDFYMDCGRYFYSVEDWINGIHGYNDFSMGTRFHGNIASILSGVPTLMVNVDKRMQGMNKYFNIPSIEAKEFDSNKPIEYYRELANYTEFNRNYKKTFDRFVEYCSRNCIELKFG